ncbi:MAG: hypothetical protein ACJZ1Z_02950 [Acidimicrobiales bacterium]
MDDTGRENQLDEESSDQDVNELVKEPDQESEVSEEETRARRQTFFRARKFSKSPVDAYQVSPGSKWSTEEADEEIRKFLTRLAGDRDLVKTADPVQFAQENDLLLLFGPDEEEEFARLALRFPEETVKKWATLLSGGSRSEAFGPRSRAERRSEAAVASELQSAVFRRLITAGIGVGLILVVFFAIKSLTDNSEEKVGLGLRFSEISSVESVESNNSYLDLFNPITEPALVATAERIVAVKQGEEQLMERIKVDVPYEALPILPGVLSATVFQYREGQIALVGPEGWVADSCTIVSVTTSNLRPLDVLHYAGSSTNCPSGIKGTEANPTCLGSSVLVLPIAIPQRSNPQKLPEGGVGWAEKVRFAIESPTAELDGWEVLSVRGTIEVPEGVENVVIPKFGGASGDQLEIDLGMGSEGPITGSCIIE